MATVTVCDRCKRPRNDLEPVNVTAGEYKIEGAELCQECLPVALKILKTLALGPDSRADGVKPRKAKAKAKAKAVTETTVSEPAEAQATVPPARPGQPAEQVNPFQ